MLDSSVDCLALLILLNVVAVFFAVNAAGIFPEIHHPKLQEVV